MASTTWRGLSVTQIERWIANPYEIYARHILRLVPLTPLGTSPDAAMRGSVFHRILNRFTKAYPDALPEDIESVLKETGEALFDTLGDDPSLLAFWRPSFDRFAEWFAATEPGRRANMVRSLPEVPGALTLPSGFLLTARADRIDEADDGTLVIYDYKTGGPPSPSHVTDLYKPQMPLAALIAQEGGFEALGPRNVSGLVYIHASGRGDGGEQQDASKERPEALAALALEKLEALVAHFDKPDTPYEVKRRANAAFASAYRFDDYAQLARVPEWLTEGERS